MPSRRKKSEDDRPRATRDASEHRNQLWQRLREHWVVTGLLLAAALVAAVPVLLQPLQWVWSSVEDRLFWREDRYKTLQDLRAGLAAHHFEERLGKTAYPPATTDDLKSLIYGGRDHWIQVVIRDETVVMFAVTSCSADFRPNFETDAGPEVTLMETTFDQGGGADYHLFNHSSTGNVWAYDVTTPANPSAYKAFAWGVGDACGEAGSHPPEDWGPVFSIFETRVDHLDEFQPELAAELRSWRRSTAVNTYAETAPFFNFDDLPDGFQIGVNKLRVRDNPEPTG